ncbi:MarR family transcriptional regulator [Haladaptatus halobius]|uniref:MarR family transcriptional regulator n=1 Tax=Haladaptatus halobius TaxID=2884875 RepID=UPI001D0A21D0
MDDDILAAIHESEFPAVTAQWVADTLGIERPSAHRRLEELHKDGVVERGN